MSSGTGGALAILLLVAVPLAAQDDLERRERSRAYLLASAHAKINQEDHAAAHEALVELRELLPDHLVAAVADAQAAINREDYAAAREALAVLPYMRTPREPTRFELYNNCEPVSVHVWVSDPTEEVGLTEQAISDLVEVRLRAARLYKPRDGVYVLGDSDSRLVVSVQTLKHSSRYSAPFRYDVKYMRLAAIDIIGTRESMNQSVTTWERGSFGYGRRDFILDSLSKRVDAFILEYLRVNEDACEAARVPER